MAPELGTPSPSPCPLHHPCLSWAPICRETLNVSGHSLLQSLVLFLQERCVLQTVWVLFTLAEGSLMVLPLRPCRKSGVAGDCL